MCQVEEELKEGINKQFNHKFQVGDNTRQNLPQDYVYCSEEANIVFNQLSPPHENTPTLQNQPITIIQQPTTITYDPMTPPASIDQSSPNTSQVIGAPLEIATTVFQQPCITSSYIELPPTTSSGIQQVYENTLSTIVQQGGLQSKQEPINISYLQTHATVVPTSSNETTAASQVLITTESDVVSSTKWINTSAADNSSSSSGLSSHPSSPSAQLSPSPPQSPNSSHASSGGSPQLVISESKPVSPSVPSSQVSPISDIETINGRKFPFNAQHFSNNSQVPNIHKPTSGPVMKEIRQDPPVGQGHKVVIQLQNHQLQELKNQLNFFVLTNSQKVAISNDTTSNVNIKEVDSTTDVELDENRFTDVTNNDSMTDTESLQYKNSKLLSVLKPSSGKLDSGLGKQMNLSNVFLKIEDDIQDEITPNSPPLCQAIAMPINVKIKQEASRERNVQKLDFKVTSKNEIVPNSSVLEAPKTCQVGGVSSLMSTAAPSFMHRLGKRPSSFSHCLISTPPSPKIPKADTKDQPMAITASCNSNVVALNDCYNVNNKNNILVGQSAIATAFITSSTNGISGLKHNSGGNIVEIYNQGTAKRSIPFNNTSRKLCTKVSATKSNQMVVLRSSLPPRVMRKVI